MTARRVMVVGVGIGLAVLLAWMASEPEEPVVPPAHEDAEAAPDAPSLRVRDTPPDTAPDAPPAEVPATGRPHRGYRTPGEAVSALVRGRVVDTAGRPVPQARFGLRTTEGTDWLIHQPGPEGHFEARVLPDADMRFMATARSYVPTLLPAVTLETGSETDLGDVVLARGRAITGQVCDQDRTAWNGATIEVTPVDEHVMPSWPRRSGGAVVPRKATTGVTGRFRIDGLAPGRYRLTIAAAYAVGRTTRSDVAAGDDIGLVELERKPPPPAAWPITVRVIAAPWAHQEDGWKDKRVEVTVVAGGRRVRRKATSLPPGSARLRIDGTGPVTLEVTVPGTAHPPLRVGGIWPSTGLVEVTLPDPTVLRGRIVGVDARRLAGARLRALQAQEGVPEHVVLGGPAGGLGRPIVERGRSVAHVTADARFELTGLPAGSVRLQLLADGLVLDEVSRVVENPARDVVLRARALRPVPLRFTQPADGTVESVTWSLHAVVNGRRRSIARGHAVPGRESNAWLDDEADACVLEVITHRKAGPGERANDWFQVEVAPGARRIDHALGD